MNSQDSQVTSAELVRDGLSQIPADGLQRLLEHLQADKPVLLTGAIFDQDIRLGTVW